MVLSEVDAEARLSDLRCQRETIDRAITDLTLFLELGRRLTATLRADADSALPGAASGKVASEAALPDPPASAHAAKPFTAAASSNAMRATPMGPAPSGRHSPTAPERKSVSGIHPPSGPDSPLADPFPSIVPEGALARRYGRALIQAAVAVLEEAGRPLHVSEILTMLSLRGFSVPGQQDPVAALNTRLWKRSGPDGPVRRLGDAIYALPDSSAVDP